MTKQQSLDDIRALLLTYPGIETAVVFHVPSRPEVHVRFRCSDAESLAAIAATSVWANIEISLGDPAGRICAESENASGLACDIEFPDGHPGIPTHVERFGVYLSADLADKGLISEDKLSQLHSGWNTRLANRKPPPPAV